MTIDAAPVSAPISGVIPTSPATQASPSIATTCEHVLTEVSRHVVGQQRTTAFALVAALSGGHLLIEDAPGMGKTTLARTLATAMGGTMRRVQGTSDLLPGDITGSMVWNQRESEFTFVPGPVFTDLLLVDEFNRMPPRTQSALLEAMAERHVTIDGRTYSLPERFTVIATQNPYEELGTYSLPSSVLDRFALRVGAEPLSFADEVRVAGGVANGTLTASAVSVVDGVDDARRSIETIHVSPPVSEFAVAVVTALRHDPRVTRRPSVRASAVLLRTSQALAAMRGRSYVLPDDVLELAPAVMAHRCASAIPQLTGEALVREVSSRVTVPVPSA